MSADSDRPAPPPIEDRYVVEARIGRGGMATVWRAHDNVLNRTVALKRLRASMREDPEAMARFLREARTVARLSHPGIVQLLDGGEDGNGPFIAMELVEGEDLRTRIADEGPLPATEAARIGAQVASTLAFAHEHGVVHRDIKSQNVMLDRDGNAKLADFGIAQLLEVSGEARLTRSGMMVGTSDYLAPEQAEGRPVDGRTDIYSLGIVLWECLTGELPFPGENFVSVAMRQVHDPLPDPRELAPDVPPRLAACILRAAAKDPDDRFATAAEFADELAACAAGEPLDEAPETARARPGQPGTGRAGNNRPPGAKADHRRMYRRRRVVALAAFVVVVLIAVWGIASLAGSGSSAPPPPAARVLPAAVVSYDPQGDHTENAAAVYLATDGNPSTAWYTERYAGSPTFGGIKTGVGLRVTVAPGAQPDRIDVRSPTPGAQIQIRTPGALHGAPLVPTTTLTGAVQRLALPAGAPSQLVVWIVRLVPDPAVPGEYRAGISEVSVWGVPNN